MNDQIDPSYDDDFPYPHLDPIELNDIANPEKELFDVVYQWGRVGVVTDHRCPTFQALIANVKAQASDRPF